jgi:hypothetical protein
MNKFIYFFNWCDYFTMCPHKNCEIGSYECTQCSNFIDNEIINEEKFKTGDYKRYISTKMGIVTCKK